MKIQKEMNEIMNSASITFDEWDRLKDFIWKMELKIEELTKSRDNWKLKYKLVREKSK